MVAVRRVLDVALIFAVVVTVCFMTRVTPMPVASRKQSLSLTKKPGIFAISLLPESDKPKVRRRQRMYVRGLRRCSKKSRSVEVSGKTCKTLL